MDALDASRAVAAATAVVRSQGQTVDEAVVLQHSNKVAVRLRPCDIVARIGPAGAGQAAVEVDLAQQLAAAGAPVAALAPDLEARSYERDGFELSLWTFYDRRPEPIAPEDFARALEALHAAMRDVEVEVAPATDRIAGAEHLVANLDLTPRLSDHDRGVLARALDRGRRAIAQHGGPDQLIHGEPHEGNLLNTASGPRFIDLETCCRGPVEFDLANAPRQVGDHYRGIDAVLLDRCREVALALAATWRWEPDDQLPNGTAFGAALIRSLRAGPPWPSLDDVFHRLRAEEPRG